MFRYVNIQRRLALVLWGTILLAYVVAGLGLVLYQGVTQEERALQIMQPYAQLISVGTEAAIAFQDPVRAQEVLDTLRANPQILAAEIYLNDGRMLAALNDPSAAYSGSVREEGVYIGSDSAELFRGLPSGATLRISMGLAPLNEQTEQAIWFFGFGALILLLATIGQLSVLRQMIVHPIETLTNALEYIRDRNDFQHHVPVKGNDEVARLGHSFNAMMKALQEKKELLLEAQHIARIGNWWHDLVTGEMFWSDELFRITGREPQKASLELSFKVVHPDDLPLLKKMINLPAKGDEEIGQELRIIRPNGEVRWVNIRWRSIYDKDDKEIRRVGTYQDISEQKNNEAALHKLNRELRAISECNQVLVRAEDEQSLIELVCRIICDDAGYLMAWVGYTAEDESKVLRPVAWAGIEDRSLLQAELNLGSSERKWCPSDWAIRNGEICVVDDFGRDIDVAASREAALQKGYQSGIALPLNNSQNNTFGVLTIYSGESGAFHEEERRLLEELAGDLAFGISAIRTRELHNHAEEQIRIAATAFEAQEGIMITDLDEKILRINLAFSEISGYTADEVVGQTPRILKSDIHDQSFFETMWHSILQEESWQGEIWNRHKNGKKYPVWLNITAVRSPLGDVTHYVGTMTDISERKAAEQEIEHLAYYDLLTDLPNRRLLLDRLNQAMIGSARSGHMGGVLFIDLDNFKLLNDTCGHDVGDQLLIKVAQRLATCVRDGDTIARLGGDEFVVVLEGLSKTQAEAATQTKLVAEKIVLELSRPYSLIDRIHHCTTTVGATLFVGQGISVDDVLKQSDIAMYQAKTAGRNTVRFFDPDMQAELAARTNIEQALRSSIERGEFVLHYQPQVDGQGNIIAVEALLRWQHPERGIVQPGEFISMAEETGMIISLGQWVLENACHQIAAWSGDPAKQHLNMAVNVSAMQFRQKDFVQRVRLALEHSGAPACRLKLELTESLVLNNVEDSIEKMQVLKAMGVGCSMDDFGTGYSSLSYLTQLPLDQLKIDRSFICNLPDNPSEAVVVQTIIMMASSLGLSIVAEGVETKAQWTFLEEHGCSVYQGYLFSKPIDLASLESMLQGAITNT